VFEPFCGFADNVEVRDSFVSLPDDPGIGFEARGMLIAEFRKLVEDLV
jgi:L-alanine-DL-glutamate epimerase-like enolase superfamily enzyme